MAMNAFVCIALLVALPALSGAFAPLQTAVASRVLPKVALSGVVTGPTGKPASSFEEDLFLTLKVIMDHDARSTTVSKEQFIMQMQEVQKLPKSLPPADVAVPYNAPAQLAYEKTDKSIPFSEFEAQYEQDAIQEVKSKKVTASASPVLSLRRKLWSIVSQFAASLTGQGSALLRRLYGAAQKVVWKIKLRGD